MLYHSTRNSSDPVGSKEAILKGLCADGGLFLSDDIVGVDFDMQSLMDKSYEEIALSVFSKLLSDYSEEELKDCISKAYAGKFETDELTPVTELGKYYLLELYHGPTSAFKDMALCMLPQLMSKALNGRRVMILTATSGDTGKAALAGFQDAENIGITVFYPHQKVSDIQYLQMATQEGGNVNVAAVNGNFDDCQTGVKKIFAEYTREIDDKYGITLSSANSINVGRLVPQVIYYIEAYKQLVKRGVIKYGDKIDFVVPTGNFGDILAGYYAETLGLPVRKLIVASNENKVLTDFFKTGVYDKNREFVKTISPSMDILVSSNLERMLYYASGCDADYVAGIMESLSTKGRFEVTKEVLDKLREIFGYGYATNEESKEAIRKAYEKDGRLIDPHTAVGYKVADDLNDGTPTVILSTASPFKFAEDVYKALFGEIEGAEGDGFRYMDELSARTGEKAPKPLAELRSKEIRHRAVVDKEKMSDFVFDSLSCLK